MQQLVFKAHRLLYHSTLGLRVIKKKKICSSTPGTRASEVGQMAPYWLSTAETLSAVERQYRTHKTVKARFWPWLSGKRP